jgi:hypothetical protein
MKRIYVLGFLMFFCLYALFAQATDEQIRQAANTLGVPYADLRQFVRSYQNNTSSGVIEVDAVTLHQAYRSNSIRADSEYKGKTLRIRGVVYRVQSDNVRLREDSMSSGVVAIYFRSTELSKIANLDVGQIVTFIGICDSGGGFDVIIKDAILVVN